jgi:hypothetical protein
MSDAHDNQHPADSLEAADERDREWLASVYRGDKEPDLTMRAVVAGMIFASNPAGAWAWTSRR